MSIQKSRLLMLAADCNPGKVAALDALLGEYVAYVRLCVERMLERYPDRARPDLTSR